MVPGMLSGRDRLLHLRQRRSATHLPGTDPTESNQVMAGEPRNEKAKRRGDQAVLAAYHEAKLADLLERVREGLERYDAGEIDAFGLDDLIHRYQLAAKELWKFCAVSGAHVGIAVRTLELWQERGETPDWWQVGERMRR